MSNLLLDIRFGFRQLGRNPGFAVIAIVTLALAIGANTAISTVANDFLFRRCPSPILIAW